VKNRSRVRTVLAVSGVVGLLLLLLTAGAAAADFITNSPVSVSGTPTVGTAFTATSGSYSPSPTSMTYQWQLCDSSGNNCANISGATSIRYIPVASDVGSTLRVVQTVSRSGYNAGGSTSAASALVVKGDFVINAPVAINGTPIPGTASTITHGVYSPSSTVTRAYQWELCDSSGNNCANIAGATTDRYKPVLSDVGSTLRVVESVSRPGYNDSGTTSAAVAVVMGNFVTNSVVSVSGTPTVGTAFAASSGSYSPTPTSMSYQWELCDSGGNNCANISGAIYGHYSPVASDVGSTLRVVQTASRYGYNPGGSTSSASAVVVKGSFVTNTAVAVNGTPTVGIATGFTAGSYAPSPSHRAYQWQLCDSSGDNCANIPGATASKYTPVAADVGSTLRVVETTSRAGYNDGGSTSAASALVVKGSFVINTPVAISGTPTPGTASTITPGLYTPSSNVSRAYQWELCDSAGNNCSNIAGATSNTYKPLPSDVASTLRVIETASRAGYNDSGTTSAAVRVDTLPSVTSDPSDSTVTAGNTASFSAAASGDPAPSVQWQVSTTGGSSWSDIPGATSTTLSFTAADGDNGKKYRARFVNPAGAVTSAAATLTVQLVPAVTLSPTDQSVHTGDTASFSAAASGRPTPTVQWQVSTDGGTSWSDLSGQTSTTLSFTAAYSETGNKYRAVFTNAAGSDTSSAATLSVNTPPTADDQSVSTNEDTLKTITLTGGDADGNALSFAIVSGPSHGSLGSIGTPNCSGTPSSCSASVDYTPNANYNGADSFTFKTNDGTDDSSTGTVSITVVSVNDPPSFTKGADQLVAKSAGAQTVSGWATNISAGPANESGQTVHFNVTNDSNPSLFSVAPAVSSSGDLTYTPATNATGNATITLDAQDNGGTANGGSDTSPTQSFTITVDDPPTVSSTSPTDGATGVAVASTITVNFSKSVNASTSSFTLECPSGTSKNYNLTPASPASSYTLTPTASLPTNTTCTVKALAAQITDSAGFHPTGDTTFSFQTVGNPPVASNDSYTATGNVGITIPTASGVTQNDTLNGGTLHGFGATSGTADGTVPNGTNTVTTSNGGTVTLASDGSFTYDPPAGYSGADSFYYNLHNSSGDSVGQATITISNMIWFVNNAAASAGDGRLDHPFNTLNGLASINSGAAPHPQSGDTIFLYSGSGNYTGGLALRSSQILIGQGASASITSISGITLAPHSNSLPSTGGTAPTITNSSGDGIDLAAGADVEGLNVSGASAAGIAASSVTSATVGATTAVGVTSSATGISVSGGSSGTLNFAGANVSGSTGHSIAVSSRSGGTVTFGGTISDTATGISLTSNTGGTINFTGTLTVSTGSQAAFTATGGGTISATGSGSTLTTTTASALTVQNTTIGSSGLNFRSISSNGAAKGIDLETTGSSGGLTVSGTGTANSGGTIQGATTAAVFLSSTSAPSLSYMQITNSTEGVKGSSVTGFTLANSTVTGKGNSGSSGQHDLDFSGGLTGTASISSSTITAAPDDNLLVTDSSGTLNLTVTGSTFSSTATTVSGATNDGMLINANGTTNATVSVTGSTFTNNRGYHFNFSTNSSSSGTNSVTFSNNTLTSSLSTSVNPLAAVFFFPFGGSKNTINVASNNIQSPNQAAFEIDQSGSGGTVAAKFTSNTVGTSSTSNSGGPSDGISLQVQGSETQTVSVSSNTIYQYGDAGVYANNVSGSSTQNVTMSGNTIGHPGTFGGWGLLLNAGGTSGDNGTVCAAFGSNTLTGSGEGSLGGVSDVEVDQSFSTTFRLPGYTGGSTDASAVESYLQAKIGGSPTAFASGTFSNTTSCPTPP
jgi:Big-like domain-containing protein/immunoglobulin I-set domain protein